MAEIFVLIRPLKLIYNLEASFRNFPVAILVIFIIRNHDEIPAVTLLQVFKSRKTFSVLIIDQFFSRF